jgi:luciferase family oxidoreductase group 1
LFDDYLTRAPLALAHAFRFSTMKIPLSVLDLSPISAGSSGAQALRNTLDLAQLADRLGYRRYWLAEHHNIPSVASTAPEVMISHVASLTSRMRVGSGGIMLPNHAPLHVAETFRVLEALHPGRMDLGIGRAPGSDTLTALALRGSKERLGANDFPQQLEDLFAFGSGQFPEGHPFRAIRALPEGVALPPVWLLGSSDFGARMAAKLGLGFAFAHHFSPDWLHAATRAYRENFQPSAQMAAPQLIVTISVVCAETDAEADRLASTLELTALRRARGQFAPLPSPEEALAYPYTPWDRQQIQSHRAQHFIGSPETVRAQIETLAAETGATEIMVSTMTHGHAERRRSYELLAAEFGLPSETDDLPTS